MSGEQDHKRLPRHRRAPEHERPPMQLTERDCAIIRLVNDCRALRSDHIEALFFNSRSTTQYRLQRLFQHEFLDRQFLTLVSAGPAASPAIYTLGKRGAQLLIAQFGYTPRDLRLPRASGLAWHTLEHLLAINDIRVRIMLEVQQQGWELESWLDETVFRADPEYITLTDKRGKSHRKPIFPDGYFRLLVPQGRAHCFLEVDRGVEPHHKFKPQIEVYEAYVASGQYQQRFSPKSLRVLVVTTSPERLVNLKVTTEKAGGDRKYWFTTMKQALGENILTTPIWEYLGSEGKQPLVALSS